MFVKKINSIDNFIHYVVVDKVIHLDRTSLIQINIKPLDTTCATISYV